MSDFTHGMRFRIDHRWAPGHMSAWCDGDLAARQRARMERHLVQCAECRRLLAGLRQTLEALHRLPATGGADAVRLADAVRVRLAEPPESG